MAKNDVNILTDKEELIPTFEQEKTETGKEENPTVNPTFDVPITIHDGVISRIPKP